MDTEKFVNNVRELCKLKGVAPKTACRESGAGDNLLTNVLHGSIPSVSKVQMLATYLGCTTSELLGESEQTKSVPDSDTISIAARDVASAYDAATPELQAAVRRVLGLM